MRKRVLDIGQCPPDHMAIRRLVEFHFDAEVVQAHGPQDTLDLLGAGPFDLVLINRKLDADYSDGMEILRRIKANARLASMPVMLITNYEDHQAAAVAAGAEPGFGKLELGQAETREKPSRFLG